MSKLKHQAYDWGVLEKFCAFLGIARLTSGDDIIRRIPAALTYRNNMILSELRSFLPAIGAGKPVGHKDCVPLAFGQSSRKVSLTASTPFFGYSIFLSMCSPILLCRYLVGYQMSLFRTFLSRTPPLRILGAIIFKIAWTAKSMTCSVTYPITAKAWLQAKLAISFCAFMLLCYLKGLSRITMFAKPEGMNSSYLFTLGTFPIVWLACIYSPGHNTLPSFNGFTIRQNDETAVGRLASIIAQALP